MLLCLVVCLTLLASFFLPSHLSLKYVCMCLFVSAILYTCIDFKKNFIWFLLSFAPGITMTAIAQTTLIATTATPPPAPDVAPTHARDLTRAPGIEITTGAHDVAVAMAAIIRTTTTAATRTAIGGVVARGSATEMTTAFTPGRTTLTIATHAGTETATTRIITTETSRASVAHGGRERTMTGRRENTDTARDRALRRRNLATPGDGAETRTRARRGRRTRETGSTERTGGTTLNCPKT